MKLLLSKPHIFTDVLTGKECDELVEQFYNGTPLPRSYQGLVDQDLRDCRFVTAKDDDALLQKLIEQAKGLVRCVPIPGQQTMLYGYPVGVGFVEHHDEVTDIELERSKSNGQPVLGGDVTIVVFLNDPETYGGGELYFVDPPLEFKPPRGSVVIFPANRDMVHGVRPVTSGERLTMVVRMDATDSSTPTVLLPTQSRSADKAQTR